jgi:paraquat-inducible protein A
MSVAYTNAARPAGPAQWALEFLLVISLMLLGAGLVLPAITVNSVWVFNREYSIFGGIQSFFEQGQTLLGLLVLFFSVILPIGKILLGFWMLAQWNATGYAARRTLKLLLFISKWAMADVFVLALVILVINGQLLTSADLKAGIGLFTAGVILSALGMLGVHRIIAAEPRQAPRTAPYPS